MINQIVFKIIELLLAVLPFLFITVATLAMLFKCYMNIIYIRTRNGNFIESVKLDELFVIFAPFFFVDVEAENQNTELRKIHRKIKISLFIFYSLFISSFAILAFL